MSLVEVLVRPSTRSNRTPPVMAAVCEDRDCCTLVLSFLFCWGVVGGCRAVLWDELLVVWGAGGGGSSGGRRYGGGGGGGESLRLSILCIVLIVYEWAAVLFPPPVSVWLLGLSLNYLLPMKDHTKGGAAMPGLQLIY